MVPWEPYNPHGLGHISRVGSVLYRSCTAYHNGRLGSIVDDLDRDLSVRRVKISPVKRAVSDVCTLANQLAGKVLGVRRHACEAAVHLLQG